MRRTPLLFLYCLLPLAATVEVCSFGLPASACSPPDPGPSYADLGAAFPGNAATDVPLDAAMAVDIYRYTTGHSAVPAVTLADIETGEFVTGEGSEYYWDRLFFRFKPARLLKPNHAYRFDAMISSSIERTETAQGVEHLQVSFTTGEAASLPLEVVGKLRVELQAYERPDYSTCSGGECSCTPSGTVPDTFAHVTLPGVRGGQIGGGYFALVMVTADQPYDFANLGISSGGHVYANAGASVSGSAGTTMRIESLGDQDLGYHPCFALRVLDLAGNVAMGEPLCLSDQRVPPIENGDNGCSVAPSIGSGSWWDLGGVLGMLWLLCRVRALKESVRVSGRTIRALDHYSSSNGESSRPFQRART